MGNLDWVGEYRLQLRLISDEPNRSEHGFHIHVMKGNKTFFKVDLNSGKIIGDVDNSMKKVDQRFVMVFIKKHFNELQQKAKQMRNKSKE